MTILNTAMITPLLILTWLSLTIVMLLLTILLTVPTHTHTRVCVYLSLSLHIYIYIHTYIHTHIYSIHAYIHIHIHNTCTFIVHVYVCIYIYIHTYYDKKRNGTWCKGASKDRWLAQSLHSIMGPLNSSCARFATRPFSTSSKIAAASAIEALPLWKCSLSSKVRSTRPYSCGSLCTFKSRPFSTTTFFESDWAAGRSPHDKPSLTAAWDNTATQ